MENQELIEEYILYLTTGRRWGTKLDDLDYKDIPTTYIALSFSEMNYDQVRKFFSATDIEKFEMAYWAEKMNCRNTGVTAFFFGIFVALFVFVLFQSLS